MSTQVVDMGTLTIPNAGTDSNVISNKVGFGSLVDWIMYAPAAFTGVVTVYVGPDENMTLANMVPLRIAGADVTLTAAKGNYIQFVGAFRSLAIKSAGAEGAQRVVRWIGQVEVGEGGF